MTPTIDGLYYYPIKGLTPHPLEQVDVKEGETFPFDRAWAIERGRRKFDPHAPKHVSKAAFLNLSRDERLASLRAQFTPEDNRLTIFRDGKKVTSGDIATDLGKQLIEQFLSAYFSEELIGAPHIVHAAGHSFSDVPEKWVHIVNLASVKDLEKTAGYEIDPLRFRANIYVDEAPPWSELDWTGKRLSFGETILEVTERTARCQAVNVDPKTGIRGPSLINQLNGKMGHMDVGVYAQVKKGGTLEKGATFEILDTNT